MSELPSRTLAKPSFGPEEKHEPDCKMWVSASPNTSWLIAIACQHGSTSVELAETALHSTKSSSSTLGEEAQIATLVEQRTAAAGIVPNFERLVVPRQVRTSPVSDEERTKRDFHRILWDYSDGNRWGGVVTSAFVILGVWIALRFFNNFIENLGDQFTARRMLPSSQAS